MTLGQMEDKVKELFAVILQRPAEEIQDASAPADLENWDSFQHLVLVSGFEEEFGIEIEPEEIAEMYKDFRTFKGVVMRKLG